MPKPPQSKTSDNIRNIVKHLFKKRKKGESITLEAMITKVRGVKKTYHISANRMANIIKCIDGIEPDRKGGWRKI
jgi:hypothetical protein